jgi:ABC-type phosphate/phosphonate transport system ATPase subunit
MKLTLPELSFVVLIGVSGSGRSTPRLRDAEAFQADKQLDYRASLHHCISV